MRLERSKGPWAASFANLRNSPLVTCWTCRNLWWWGAKLSNEMSKKLCICTVFIPMRPPFVHIVVRFRARFTMRKNAVCVTWRCGGNVPSCTLVGGASSAKSVGKRLRNVCPISPRSVAKPGVLNKAFTGNAWRVVVKQSAKASGCTKPR